MNWRNSSDRISSFWSTCGAFKFYCGRTCFNDNWNRCLSQIRSKFRELHFYAHITFTGKYFYNLRKKHYFAFFCLKNEGPEVAHSVPGCELNLTTPSPAVTDVDHSLDVPLAVSTPLSTCSKSKTKVFGYFYQGSKLILKHLFSYLTFFDQVSEKEL